MLDLLKKVLDIIGGIFSLILIIILVGVFAIAVPFVLLVVLVVDAIANRSKCKKRGDSNDSEHIE